jgi:hypothetical protein
MPQKSNPDANTLYQTTGSAVFQAENIRWARLNNFLLLESILAVAWGVSFTNDDLRAYPLLLSVVCGLGIVFGIQWAGLGYRSSKFVNMFHGLAEKMEAGHGPFTASREYRRQHWGIFKSATILVAVPILFVTLFSALMLVSWILRPERGTVALTEGGITMEFAVQLSQLIGAGALVATLLVVIVYTIKTAAMARATEGLAAAEDKSTEFRERPIVRFIVEERTRHPFNFPTHIDNIGTVHAKIRVKATVIHKEVELKFSSDSLYYGKRTMEMQARTGVLGHLNFPGLFKTNNVPVPTLQQAKNSPTKNNGRELLVRLESRVINYYKPESDFDTNLSKNPPAYFRWKGDFAIDASGSWIPEYDVSDFDSFPEMT